MASPPSDKPVGRPSYKNEETVRRIVTTLAIGLNLKTAAAYAGISYSTLANWRATDPEFLKETDEARARAVISPTAKAIEVMRNEPLLDEDKNGTIKKDADGKPLLRRNKKGELVRPYSTAEQLSMVKWFLERRAEEFKVKTEQKVEVVSMDEEAEQIAKLIAGMDQNVLAADNRFASKNGTNGSLN